MNARGGGFMRVRKYLGFGPFGDLVQVVVLFKRHDVTANYEEWDKSRSGVLVPTAETETDECF